MHRQTACLVAEGPDRFWHVPRKVLQVIRRRRSKQPAPRMYVGALVLGLLLGILADLQLAVAWWVVPPAMVAGVWLFFLGTVFTGAGRVQPLRRELQDAVFPQGRQELRERDDDEAFRTSGLPLFAVAGWHGFAFAGGYSCGSGGVRSLTMSFRIQSAETPAVTVTTVADQRRGLQELS